MFTGPSCKTVCCGPEHEAARQELLDTDGMLWQIWLDIALTIFGSMPSGEVRVVNAKEEMLEAMCRLGWCNSSVSLPSLLLVDEVLVPITYQQCLHGSPFLQRQTHSVLNVFEVLGMPPYVVYHEFLHSEQTETISRAALEQRSHCCCSGRQNCHGHLITELCAPRVEQRRLYTSAFFLFPHTCIIRW